MAKVEILDLSHWKRRVDHARVAAAGIRAVILKASDGATFGDPFFAYNKKKFEEVGVAVHSYHYWRFLAAPMVQVETFLTVLEGVDWIPREITRETMFEGGQMWIDAEDKKVPIQSKQASSSLKMMARGIEIDTTIAPGYYTRATYWDPRIRRSAEWAWYQLWAAHYGALIPDLPRDWIDYFLHQNSEHGKIPGINGGVDTNRLRGEDPGPDPDPDRRVRVTVHALSIREGPGVEWPVRAYAQRGDILQVYNERGRWLKVSRPDQIDMWIAAVYSRGPTIEEV